MLRALPRTRARALLAPFFGLALFACDGAGLDVDGGPDDAGPSDGGVRDDGGDGGGDDGGEPECMDECAAGSQSCDGTGQYRVCGQYDIDACLEPSPPIRCADGFTCSAGACVPPCRDECPTGSTISSTKTRC